MNENIDSEYIAVQKKSKDGYSSFVFWETMKTEFIDLLTDETQKAKMCMAIIDYGLYGIIPQFNDNGINIAWKQLQRQLLQQQKNRKTHAEQGNKGGRPKTQGSGILQNATCSKCNAPLQSKGNDNYQCPICKLWYMKNEFGYSPCSA